MEENEAAADAPHEGAASRVLLAQLGDVSEINALGDTSLLVAHELQLDSQLSEEAETSEWKKVPSVLRETIKNILLSLQQHGQLLEKTKSGEETIATMRLRIQELESRLTTETKNNSGILPSPTAAPLLFNNVNAVKAQMPLPWVVDDEEWRAQIIGELDTKVNKSTLEHVVEHLITRTEVRRYIERRLKSMKGSADEQGLEVGKHDDKLSENAQLRFADLTAQIRAVSQDCAEVRAEINLMRGRALGVPASNDDKVGNAHRFESEDWGARSRTEQNLLRRVMHAIDERMYLISAEISSLQARIAGTAAEGSRRGVWLWKTGALKHGSAIAWTYEAQNSDQSNYLWEPEDCVIKIVEQGVYALGFAFFTRIKPSVQLVVNGESVLSAIHSPTYTVHHGSGLIASGSGRLKAGSTTGLSLVEYLCVPARSTICLHWHGKVESAVEGFLELRRIILKIPRLMLDLATFLLQRVESANATTKPQGKALQDFCLNTLAN